MCYKLERNSLFKAAGLGHKGIAEYIVQRYPSAVSAIDALGRTPLHYAALLKDDGQMFDFLVQAGVDESVLDSVEITRFNNKGLRIIFSETKIGGLLQIEEQRTRSETSSSSSGMP